MLQYNNCCFSIDCIRSFDAVKDLVQASVKACDDCLLIIRARASAEEAHSKNLARISLMEWQYCKGSTLQDSMDQFKSDMNHKANQHHILAENFIIDIYEPIAALKNQLVSRQKSLLSQCSSMQKEIQRQEQNYRRSWSKYDKSYREAHGYWVECKAAGVSEPVLTPSMFEEREVTSSGSPNAPNQVEQLRTTVVSSAGGFLSQALPPSTFSALASTTKNGKELLSWAIQNTATSLAGWTESGDLRTAAVQQLQNAERCRRVCLDCWRQLVQSDRKFSVQIQILLTKFQGMVETFLILMQDHLRKLVILESSAIANLQYDLQMLFKVFESTSPERDLLVFMSDNQSRYRPEEFACLADVLVGAPSPDSLPPPPPSGLLACPVSPVPPSISRDEMVQSLRLPLLYRNSAAEEEGVDTEDGLPYGQAEATLKALIELSQLAKRKAPRSDRRGRSDNQQSSEKLSSEAEATLSSHANSSSTLVDATEAGEVVEYKRIGASKSQHTADSTAGEAEAGSEPLSEGIKNGDDYEIGATGAEDTEKVVWAVRSDTMTPDQRRLIRLALDSWEILGEIRRDHAKDKEGDRGPPLPSSVSI